MQIIFGANVRKEGDHAERKDKRLKYARDRKFPMEPRFGLGMTCQSRISNPQRFNSIARLAGEGKNM
jgi:hypothetical protein